MNFKKQKYGFQETRQVKGIQSHIVDKKQKQKQVKLQQKQQNQLVKQLAVSPLLVGVGCYQQEIQNDIIFNQVLKLQQISQRPVNIVPINMHEKYPMDQILPLNLLIVITNDVIDLPQPFKSQFLQMKLQNQVAYWKINQEDTVQLQLNQIVPIIQKSKIVENVIYASIFDLEIVNKYIQNIKGDFRAIWMQPRGVGRILEAKQLNETDFELKVIGQGKISGAAYITKLGDFQVISYNETEVQPFYQEISSRNQENNIIDQENAPSEHSEHPEEETNEIDDYSQTDIIECTDAPIEKDYEFKLAQIRETLEEKLSRPDDVEIHPKRSLRTTLDGFAPMKSIRTSNFPFNQPPTQDMKQLYHIQQPGQLEREILKATKTQPGPISTYFSSIFTVTIRLISQEILTHSTNQREILANFFPQDQVYQQLLANLPLYQPVNFSAAQLTGETVVFTLPHEQKVSLAHANIVNFASSEIVEMTQQMTIQVGFRRIFTLPTPYQMVSPCRGKLLRVYKTEVTTELNLAFPCPLNAIHTQTPPVLIYTEGFLGSGKIRAFSAKFTIFERITLTGWPYRIHKRRCLVRFMFFNCEDIKYFCSAQLSCGQLNGKVLAPMGEKGYFKAQFDGQMQNGQVIEMKLYKTMISCGLNFGLIGMQDDGFYQIFDYISKKWKESEKFLMEGF